MFCDFCGKKLANHSKYCRHCGGQQSDQWEDTQPLPIIDAATLSNTKQLILEKRTLRSGFKIRKMIYILVSLATIVVLIYILATFKTIKEYQILTVIIGGMLIIYMRYVFR